MLTVLLPVKNVAAILEDCLAGLLWADEILLIDGQSTDGTLQLAAKYPNLRVLQHESGDIRILISESESEARNPWILWACADEIFPPELGREIQVAIREAPPEVEAFRIPARSYLFGADFGDGGREPRLWRKGTGKFAFKGIHDMPEFQGKVGLLRTSYLHVNNPNMRTIVPKIVRYNSIDAERATDDQCAGVNPGFWYQLMRFNYFAVKNYFPYRKLGFPATCHGLSSGINQVMRHLLMVEERRIRRGEIKRDTHGWK